jgi:hypothetical protein
MNNSGYFSNSEIFLIYRLPNQLNRNLGSIYLYCISIKNIKKCENGLVIAHIEKEPNYKDILAALKGIK